MSILVETVEVSALPHPSVPAGGPSPLLRLASDERLVALVRRGHHGAFEAIVSRYQTRLLAFCRHMLSSREDAEDVLQEVFAASFNALLADERAINLRPWLYRIARNRCLNHLRRQTAIGVDSMDVHYADGGESTVEKVTKREDFRMLMKDVSRLPETQRTALLLREIDSLSYDQISEAMETTVPAVKSLLVRARVTLAEAAEARRLSCSDVRLELGAIAEGIASMSPPIRRHLKDCDRCDAFQDQLRANNRALAAIMPFAPLLMLKKVLVAKLGLSGGAGGAAASATAGATGATGSGAALTAGALATKAAATLAAAALVTAGAVEVHDASHAAPVHHHHAARIYAAAAVTPPPRIVAAVQQPLTTSVVHHATATAHHHGTKTPPPSTTTGAPAATTTPPPKAAVPPATTPVVQQINGSTTLPSQPQPSPTAGTETQTPPAPSDSGSTGSTGATGDTSGGPAPVPVPAPASPAPDGSTGNTAGTGDTGSTATTPDTSTPQPDTGATGTTGS